VAQVSPSAPLPFVAPARPGPAERIVVAVRIDGAGPFHFLVDTGADSSMVSPELVRELGLTAHRDGGERVQGTTGIERLPWVLIRRLRVGSIIKHDLRMPVSDSPVMIGLDGILGMAGFGPVRVVVDFRRREVTIERSSRRILGSFLKISARRTIGGLLVIPARVADVPVEAVIDTGSADTFGNGALRKALLNQPKSAALAAVYGVTRQVASGGVARAPPIYLGPAAIRNLAVVYSDIPIFRVWHLRRRPALLIGMNVLGTARALILDYPRARVYLLTAPPSSVRITHEFFPIP
jgi:predicted aspartyl protease